MALFKGLRVETKTMELLGGTKENNATQAKGSSICPPSKEKCYFYPKNQKKMSWWSHLIQPMLREREMMSVKPVIR